MNKYLIEIFKKSHCVLNFAATIFSLLSYLKIKGWYGNTIRLRGAFLDHTHIHIAGKNNLIKIAPENRLFHCVLHIRGNNCQIYIEEHCILTNLELWIEDDGGRIVIGYRTTAEGGHIAATEGETILIGEDCMFSHRIEIRNGDSHAIFDYDSKCRINAAKPIKIGNHVWLGADVKVLKGSLIEDGSIISAGAIVTGQVECQSIYAGVPAKKIKENIYWERERL